MLAGNHSPARLEQPYEISIPDDAEPDTKKKKNNKAIPKPESKNVIDGMLKKFPGHNFGELNGYFHCFHCKKPVNIGTHGQTKLVYQHLYGVQKDLSKEPGTLENVKTKHRNPQANVRTKLGISGVV
jgi:hypothetical protein